MKFFKRWRRSRSRSTTAEEPTRSVAPEPPTKSPPQRPRRPSTMGRTMAEQAYLAEAALRAKQHSE